MNPYYLAGLVERTSVYRTGDRPVIDVTVTDKDLADRYLEAFGPTSAIYTPAPRPRANLRATRTQYRVKVAGGAAAVILRDVAPYLSRSNRERALAAIDETESYAPRPPRAATCSALDVVPVSAP